MVACAIAEAGADAAVRFIPTVRPEQLPALIGVLAHIAAHGTLPGSWVGDRRNAAAWHKLKHLTEFTDEQRRVAHAAYARGERGPWVVAGEREYQRVNKRALRAERKAG